MSEVKEKMTACLADDKQEEVHEHNALPFGSDLVLFLPLLISLKTCLHEQISITTVLFTLRVCASMYVIVSAIFGPLH